jgi:hypothetical protein
MRRIATIALVTIAAVLSGVVVAANTANAHSAPGEQIGYLKRATTSYQEPSNRSIPVHFGLKQDQKVLVVCFIEGQEVNGNNVWFRIGQDGKLGFIPRDVVNGVNPDALKHC